ncbi:MAG: elongation factor G [Pseudomonadota bacterium]
MASHGTGETRVVALVGPFHSGKTTLLESILVATGAAHRKGPGGQRLVGDGSAEAKAREMGIDVNIASTDYLGERFTFLDCPGSIEFFQETLNALACADAAVIVAEPEMERVLALAPVFKALEDLAIPRFVMINKIDRANGSLADLAEGLSRVSRAPIVLRHIPIREGEAISGYVDLAAAKAHVYRPGEASHIIAMPESVSERFALDRYAMLEKLADFDDALLEKLLEDIEPEKDEVFADLARDVQEGLIVPVFLGAAMLDEGTRRLLKALRHELPPFAKTLARLGFKSAPDRALAQVIKTFHTPHAGKLSVARLYGGAVKDGDTLNGERVSGVFAVTGQQGEKAGPARAGDVIGLGRLEKAATGDTLGGEDGFTLARPPVLSPVYRLALAVESRNDEVKLSGALAKLGDEDPSLKALHDEDTHELVLMGQGEVHVSVAVERLKSRFGIAVSTHVPQVPYKETIRKSKTHHARHKKQSGGHGQFGDVVVEIAPLAPGTGFVFQETIHGGAIPRQYIPSVEAGVRDYLKQGPLGFPVVDVGVTLTDGKYHAVDSSDMAFQIAGRQAMAEALPDCAPTLLEPISHVKIHVPNEFTAKANAIISTRRGQILGFDARSGWTGWDTVEAHIPQAETRDLIIELRSLTAGAGTFEAKFDHLSELSGRLAEQVIAQRREAHK